MSEQTQVYVLNYPPAYSRSLDGGLEPIKVDELAILCYIINL